MQTPQLVSVLVASGTWVGFASTMRTYFRYSGRHTAAKAGLIVTGFVCSVAQIAVIAASRPPGQLWLILGAVAYGLANCLFWWALNAHGKSNPAFAFIQVPPSSLTTAGPYRLVRHPIYSAYLLAWCAGAATASQPWLLLAPVCMAVFYVSAARREERSFLTTDLANPYRQYQQRTGMFFPKLNRLLPSL
jgi:protein-S-isoprenylcysteine O-methyltransferase Ste14